MAGSNEKKAFLKGPKRQRILDAALSVFTRKGYGDTTVPDIAGEAGVAVGTMYNYFPGKQELLVALMIDRFFSEPFIEILESTNSSDTVGFLAAFLENRIRFGRENVDNFVFLLSEVQRNSEVREQWVQQIVHPTLEKLQSFLSEGMADGKYKAMNSEVISRAIAGMGIGFMLMYSIEKEKSTISQSDPVELARELAQLIEHGIERSDHDR